MSSAPNSSRKRKASSGCGDDSVEHQLLNRCEEFLAHVTKSKPAESKNATFAKEMAEQLDKIDDEFRLETVKRQIRDFIYDARFRLSDQSTSGSLHVPQSAVLNQPPPPGFFRPHHLSNGGAPSGAGYAQQNSQPAASNNQSESFLQLLTKY